MLLGLDDLLIERAEHELLLGVQLFRAEPEELPYARARARFTASLLDGALTVIRSTRSVTTVAVYDAMKLLMLCRSPSLCKASPATVRLCAMAWSSTIAWPGAASGPFVRRIDVDAW